MNGEPPFALCGPTGTLIADGVGAHYPDVAAAQRALRCDSTRIVVGALPFDITRPAALLAPDTVRRADTPPHWPTSPLPAVRVAAQVPTPPEHAARIASALEQLRAGRRDKVVLARELRLVCDGPVDARIVLARLLAADPGGYGYLADLSPAGDPYRGAVLVGASPELLVARHGDTVTCRPFAGSAPRALDPESDRANAATLAASAKDRHEHQLVIHALHETLRPLCHDLTVAATPELSHTATLWHLSTPVSGRLRDTSTTALDLALALHPTPAVGGVPTRAAMELIDRVEDPRGFYAGAAGWCDGRGNGCWVVSIRGAQLSADRRSAVAHSGGGIVAESDPDDEVAETTTKFATILNALGVSP